MVSAEFEFKGAGLALGAFKDGTDALTLPTLRVVVKNIFTFFNAPD